jgi:hypothetical protein
MEETLKKKATLIIVREEVLGKKTPTQLLEVCTTNLRNLSDCTKKVCGESGLGFRV